MSRKNQPNAANTYLQEADDLLADIEASALSLASEQTDAETVNRIFRAFHTIKGSGSMFGFADVASFTHHVETLLDEVREGRVPLSDELSNIILGATDQIRLLLAAAQGGKAADTAFQMALLDRIHKLSAPSTGSPVAAAKTADTSKTALSAWDIFFQPDPVMLVRGANPLPLFRELRELGDCTISAGTDRVPPLAELDPEACYLSWKIRLTGDTNLAAIRDVFLFVEDGSDLRIEPASESPLPAAAADSSALAPAVANPPQVTPPVKAKAPTEQPETSSSIAQAAPKEAIVRVPATRLDRLVNLVGELVMNHSRLATAAARFESAELAEPVEEIERLVSELRDDVLQIRMMPIGSIFGKFRRLVHDLSRQLDKEIALVTEGEETELDKSILDQLGEPLVHLLRNSIDHGIENAADRVARGKPRQGAIRLVATHRGSDVVVSIEDDGKGLDREAIRAKAIAKNLIAADATLTEKEIFNLILLPGFSTAQSVTSISGRGVGMDVVKRQIDALRGTLSIASTPGKGSCISLTLPLTLAIIDGLLVQAGESQYIIPMPMVTENVDLPFVERERNNGRNVIAVRGELIPYIDLREVFQMPGKSPAISKIVLVRHEEHRVGLVVDRVMGTHQTVIQSLGRFFRKINVVSGSTVMGDGRVALILDLAGIVRLADARNSNQGLPQAAA